MDTPNKPNQRLFTIKVIHTIVWVFFVVMIFYILYAGIADKIGILVWFAISLVVIEGIVLLINGWKCPLTILGQNYTDDTDAGFDIFLPKWLAKNNKVIFTTIYFLGVAIVIYRLLT